MSNAVRRQAILRLVRDRAISTQSELVEALREEGAGQPQHRLALRLLQAVAQLTDGELAVHARAEDRHPLIGEAALEHARVLGMPQVDAGVDAEEDRVVAQPGPDSQQLGLRRHTGNTPVHEGAKHW